MGRTAHPRDARHVGGGGPAAAGGPGADRRDRALTEDRGKGARAPGRVRCGALAVVGVKWGACVAGWVRGQFPAPSFAPVASSALVTGWKKVSPPLVQSPLPPEVRPTAESPENIEPPLSPGSAHTSVCIRPLTMSPLP